MVATLTSNPSQPVLRGSYDRQVDVLHLGLGDPVEVEGDGLPNGVELDFSLEENRPCGVTIIGFSRNGWNANVRGLAAIVADHLGLDTAYVLRRIEDIAGDQSPPTVIR